MPTSVAKFGAAAHNAVMPDQADTRTGAFGAGSSRASADDGVAASVAGSNVSSCEVIRWRFSAQCGFTCQTATCQSGTAVERVVIVAIVIVVAVVFALVVERR